MEVRYTTNRNYNIYQTKNIDLYSYGTLVMNFPLYLEMLYQ